VPYQNPLNERRNKDKNLSCSTKGATDKKKRENGLIAAKKDQLPFGSEKGKRVFRTFKKKEKRHVQHHFQTKGERKGGTV